MIPVVIEQTSRGERSYDIYSRLLQRPHHYADRPKLKTIWLILLLPNCFSWMPKIVQKIFTFISIHLVVPFQLVGNR